MHRLSTMLGLACAAASPAFAQPTIVESGWYLAEEFALNGAYSARFNAADGRVYAASRVTGSTGGIYVFDASGVATHLVTVDTPAGLAVEADGDLFYALDTPGTIERLPFLSTTPATWVTGFHAGDDDPIGLSIAPTNANFTWLNPGDALVADRGNSGPDEIWKWNPAVAEGETVVHADGGSILVNPVEVAIGATRVYIADDAGTGLGVIYTLAADGTVTPMPGSGVSRPAAIAIDPSAQDLIVNDAELDRIVRIDEQTGAVSDMFTGFANLAANCIDVFDHGRAILVSDFIDDRVYLFRRTRTTCLGAPFATIDDADPVAAGRFGLMVEAAGRLALVVGEAENEARIFELQSNGAWSGVIDFGITNPIHAVALDREGWAFSNASFGVSSVSVFKGFGLLGTGIYGAGYGIVSGWGDSLALFGNDLFVGSPGSGNGHVHVFRHNGSNWTFSHEITLPTFPAQVGGISPSFGFSIDCDGDTLLIGAPGVDDFGPVIDRGAAYYYKRDPGTGEWTLAQEMLSGSLDAGQQFGYDVAVSGSSAVVGAPFTDDLPETGNGHAAVHHLDPIAGNWTVATNIFGGDPSMHFGMNVDISDSSLAIGAPNSTVGGLAQAGNLFVWERTAPDVWTFFTSAWGTEVGERVGESFALNEDDLLLLGLPYTDVGPDPDAGLVYPIYLGDCPDCNGDALPDSIQIIAGLADADDDSIPDTCEPIQNFHTGTIHPNIQNAVDEALASGGAFRDLILLPPGTYIESVTVDRSLEIGPVTPGVRPVIKGANGAYGTAMSIREGASVFQISEVDFGDGPSTASPGSAITVYGGKLTASDVGFSGLTDGAVRIYSGGQATIHRCNFVGNSSQSDATALWASSASLLTVGKCTFVGNYSTLGAGSALFVLDTSLRVYDSLFLGNHTDNSIAPAIRSGDVIGSGFSTRIANCTFVANTSGAAVAVIDTDGSTSATIASCLFAPHPGLVPINDAAAVTDVTYCLAEASLPGTGNLTGDPMFASNPDPGPDLTWGTPDDVGDPTPWIGSPAIDAGDSLAYLSAAGSLAISSLDLAGNTRAVDATSYANSGNDVFGVIDIGALEAAANTPSPPSACPGDINGDGSTNAADFTILAGNFGGSVTPSTNGDLNGDGLVNAADFVILAGDFGCGTP